QPLHAGHPQRLGDPLELGQQLALQLRAVDGRGIQGHAPSCFFSNSSCNAFQSASNRSSPMSVSGCLTSFENTSNGMVATSAPSFAASITCIGWRSDAARTFVSYPCIW